MTILVVGASGATGRQLVEQLLIQRHKVKVIVRSPEKLPELWKSDDNLQIISASILELTVNEMRDLNGGFICGGWCIALIVVLVLASTTPAY